MKISSINRITVVLSALIWSVCQAAPRSNVERTCEEVAEACSCTERIPGKTGHPWKNDRQYVNCVKFQLRKARKDCDLDETLQAAACPRIVNPERTCKTIANSKCDCTYSWKTRGQYQGCVRSALNRAGKYCPGEDVDYCESDESLKPSRSPSLVPTKAPSSTPSVKPSRTPTKSPSPSYKPSNTPTTSTSPSSTPSQQPSSLPSVSPSDIPSLSTSPSASPTSSPNLEVMSGSWGVGWRLQGGDHESRSCMELPIQGDKICSDFADFKNPPKYIIVNLSNPADGGFYTSPHSVLDSLDVSTRLTPTRDNPMDLITGVKENCDLKIIVYVASEGPAKLKHYAKCSASVGCTERRDAWEDCVAAKYGSDSSANLKLAFANDIMKEYARKFKGLIDGYWFDHCNANYCDGSAVHQAIADEDPDAVIAFNADNRKSPLVVQTPWEDYTSGHPNPIGRFANGYYSPAYACHNGPMIDSVEAGENGYIVDATNGRSLGHVFMASGGNGWDNLNGATAWMSGPIPRNGAHDITLTNQLHPPPGVNGSLEWMKRTMLAGGAWTWNVPRKSLYGNCGDPSAWYTVNESHLNFLKDVTDRLDTYVIPDEKRCNTDGSYNPNWAG